MATIDNTLQDTNQKLLNQDHLLLESIDLMNQTNNNLANGNVKLKDQGNKMVDINENNKNIKSKYIASNKILSQAKRNIIKKKVLLMFFIFVLFLADIVLIIYRFFLRK